MTAGGTRCAAVARARRRLSYLDGRWQSTRSGISGSLSNSYGVALGGKSRCDQVSVVCDYFAGDVDYVRIQKG